ncbi:MAG TPA: nucleoside hydrolase [Candidatus Limnocylindria bacterium]|nr:nucleoside hydrolase [Candidatus Limnocylindria bacterium]
MRRRPRPTACLAGILAVTAVLAACAGTSGQSSSPTPSPVGGSGVIVIDTDMGADDILALAVLLSSEDVDVRAVTVAATGLAHCAGGVRVLRGLLHELGRGDIPVGCGREQPGDGGRAFPEEWRAAADGGYGLSLPDVDAGRTCSRRVRSSSSWSPPCTPWEER